LRPTRGSIAVVHSQLLAERGGKVVMPYLIDPNTRISMYESAEIQRYLRKTYGS
jgi:glutathione S-transferase